MKMAEKKPIVSIIVPVYNTQQWLGQCIQSLQNQILREIEVILVDDGSTDFSGILCDAYADSDRRIRVIHQPNAGVSAARNAGIGCAQGKYAMFCDSDDFVAPEWCMELVRLAETHPNAWVCGSHAYVDGKGSVRQTGIYDEARSISKINYGVYLDFFKYDLYRSVWNQVFELKTLLEKKLYFPENISYGEDALFVLSYWKEKACGIVSNQKPLYYYRRWQTNSLSTKFLGMNHFDELRQEFHLLKRWISPEEENGYLCWQFWRLGPKSINAVLDSRNPHPVERQLEACRTIVEAPEFRQCCLAAVPEDTVDPILRAMRQGDFKKIYSDFPHWIEEKNYLSRKLRPETEEYEGNK